MPRKSTIIPANPNQLGGHSIDNAPAQNETLPAGPFKTGRKNRRGNLLLFTPRNPLSTLIDLMTGQYGYSHLAVDCGEVDIPSGKIVMTEVTEGKGVHNAFQDEYGSRKYVRIPLQQTGVDVRAFCDCVRSKLGEQYDNEEALTGGVFHNPAREVCSDLATICLPENMRNEIAHHHRTQAIHPLAAVHVYDKANGKFRLFVSPNGFAEYFGAPKGEKLKAPDQLSQPGLHHRRYWVFAIAALIGLTLVWLWSKKRQHE